MNTIWTREKIAIKSPLQIENRQLFRHPPQVKNLRQTIIENLHFGDKSWR